MESMQDIILLRTKQNQFFKLSPKERDYFFDKIKKGDTRQIFKVEGCSFNLDGASIVSGYDRCNEALGNHLFWNRCLKFMNWHSRWERCFCNRREPNNDPLVKLKFIEPEVETKYEFEYEIVFDEKTKTQKAVQKRRIIT